MKTVLIIGGTNGIGKATAISLAKRNYSSYNRAKQRKRNSGFK